MMERAANRVANSDPIGEYSPVVAAIGRCGVERSTRTRQQNRFSLGVAEEHAAVCDETCVNSGAQIRALQGRFVVTHAPTPLRCSPFSRIIPSLSLNVMKTPSTIHAVDAHACGEHGRVIVGGVPDIPGKSMFDKMVFLRENLDGLRKLMLREPRGYPAANCNLLLPSSHPDADAGFVIMEQVEYPGMSGTNTICVTTVLLETGIVPMKEPVTELRLETPAGLITVRADCSNGKVTRVTFRNVPAFAAHLDAIVDVPTLGSVTVDVAYGGMWYAIADAAQFGLQLTPDEGRDIVRIGELVKAATREQLPAVHPEQPDFNGVTISQLSLPPALSGGNTRNAVIVSTGEVDWDNPSTWVGAIDRSPCGTGTCAKMAVLHAKGRLALNTDFVHEGILGTTFVGRLLEQTRVGGYGAVVPTIGGQGWITGRASYVVDPSDPFPEGYTVGDIW
jgi:proline racemase